jgi:hypothetical protein
VTGLNFRGEETNTPLGPRVGWVEIDFMGWVLWSVFGYVKIGCIRYWGKVERVLCKCGLE